jgi:predicted RNase H-like HicB family nuclease
MNTHSYLVVVEKADGNYSAFSPEVEGCVATGSTIDETLYAMREALLFHLEGMLEEGLPLPGEQSLEKHLSAGRLRDDAVSDEYLISRVMVSLPAAAA